MSKRVFLENTVLFFLALLVAIGGVYSYKLMSILMPLIALILLWKQGGIKNCSSYISPPFVFIILFLFWGGISFLWAKHPPSVLSIVITMSSTCLFTFILVAVLAKATPDLILKASTLLKIAGFILIFLIIFQNVIDELHIRIFNINRYKEGPYIYMMKPSGSILGLGAFISCGLLWVQNKRILSIATFVLLVLLISLTRCQTAIYGIVLSTFVFLLSYAIPFWMTRLTLVASYTFLILSPFLYFHILSVCQMIKLKFVLQNATLFHRFLGWSFLSEKFLERPFLGWGLGSTPYLPTGAHLPLGYQNVVHPHNGGLQAYVELGLIGGILFAILFSSVLWLVEKYIKDRLSVAVCNATLVFWFVQTEVTQSLWHNHWISWVGLITGFMIVFLKVRKGQLHDTVDHSKPPLTPQKE